MRAPALQPINTPGYGVTLRLDHSLISDLPVFAGLSSEELDALLARAHARHYAKGATVFSQNESAHSFFLLLHGRLRVTQLTPHGEQNVVRFVSPGDLFGVAMAIGRDTYPGTATAIVDSLALLWPSATWPPLIGQDIAEMTATTLHTVSRIISAWEAAGIIAGGRQRIAIRDRARLQIIADEM